ncbi:hypothetical protein J6590_046715 [Homalodisca vitripennis]|nr:hypothetical protein J6590_046715 [Homalodisca vitripennis]
MSFIFRTSEEGRRQSDRKSEVLACAICHSPVLGGSSPEIYYGNVAFKYLIATERLVMTECLFTHSTPGFDTDKIAGRTGWALFSKSTTEPLGRPTRDNIQLRPNYSVEPGSGQGRQKAGWESMTPRNGSWCRLLFRDALCEAVRESKDSSLSFYANSAVVLPARTYFSCGSSFGVQYQVPS